MFTKIVALALVAAVLASVMAAQPQPTTVPPVPWPAVHKHQEIQYTMNKPGKGNNQIKQFYYNFPQMQLKVVGKSLFPNALTANFSLSSYWLNNTLNIYTFTGFIAPICVELDMGFGMMVPNWMAEGSSHMGDLFLTRNYREFAEEYTFARWTQKSAGKEGNFHYFSNATTGLPFRMDGPSPAGRVVNEYLNFETVPGFEPSTFELPRGITCKKASSVSDATKYLRAALADLSSLADAAEAHVHSLVLPARR